MMLDFHQQDGRFKVSDHPDMSNTLTSHMGTGGNNVPLIHQVDEIERESMPPKMVCRADTQANAAQGFDLSPTLMAHAGQDAPFIYPAQAMGKTCSLHSAQPMESNCSSTISQSMADGS